MTRKRNPLAIKNRNIAKLATKALKDKFKAKPPKGYKYLKELNPGDYFQTSSGSKGIFVSCQTNAKVIMLDVNVIDEEDRNYYLGKKTISGDTEVKEL
jgi:preprotein translocase subunit YajC